MSRLVIVSNRVSPDKGDANPGGLATALRAALEESGGVWFGWSGNVADAPGHRPELTVTERFTTATLDLSPSEFEGYYDGLANRALWPAFHGRLDLVRVDHAAYAVYRSVNRRFARALQALCQDGDAVWVHDYHLVPLGAGLRSLGNASPMGFFLHVPFPSADVFSALPWSRELARDLAAYDLVGFQTADCARNFRDFVHRYVPDAEAGDDWVRIGARQAWTEAHPIGIDAQRFVELAASPAVAARAARLGECLGGRVGIVGVERLDYSKGIAQRFKAIERLFEQSPEYLDRVTMFQVAAPSRQTVPDYQQVRAELEALSGRINARFGSFDWQPIRYLHRAFTHVQVAALFRACQIGLVTPLRDGMNLVAKEYIAAQDPAAPGVLVLSSFAGAARQLSEALLVNPYDVDDIARGLRTAIAMPAAERLTRWKSAMRGLERDNVHRWRRRFLHSVAATRADRTLLALQSPRRAGLWTTHFAEHRLSPRSSPGGSP